VTTKALLPGQTIGIIGGGQLGRMLALSAAQLGLKCHIFCPEDNAPASQVSDQTTLAAYDDLTALAQFASQVDVVTYEFENIPADSVAVLEANKPVYPSAQALAVSQDRLDEKTFIAGLGLSVAPFYDITSLDSLRQALDKTGGHGILKTRRLGYDGKGQWRVTPESDLKAIVQQLDGQPAILEALIDFEREVSVVVARDRSGNIASYAPIENVHENHILKHSTLPANLSPERSAQAAKLAESLIAALDYVGVLSIETFVTQAGLMVNEIAPRVHNSGHLTQDACACGQFEQHIRAISGWPLGSPDAHSDAVMTNLLGDDIHDWQKWAAQPNTSLHLYGKDKAKAGRKMGHVTQLKIKSS
jgi:5-(carboxyamino)imidazole ribonucleotide synthase